SEASRPGMSSARKTTFIPGRAHISSTFDFSRRRWRREPVLFLIKTAPIAPSAPAVKAIPPNKRLLAFFISRSQNSRSQSVSTKHHRRRRLNQDRDLQICLFGCKPCSFETLRRRGCRFGWPRPPRLFACESLLRRIY